MSRHHGAHVGTCYSEGCVSEQIEKLCIKRYGSVTPNNMRALLMSYDGNGDGTLNRDELARLISDADAHIPKLAGYAPDKILGKMDSNHDGGVSWDEFVAVSPQYAGADAAPPADAAPAEESGGLLSINRILKPRISARNLTRTPMPISANVDQAAAEVKKPEFPIVPVAVGVTALGLLWLVVR